MNSSLTLVRQSDYTPHPSEGAFLRLPKDANPPRMNIVARLFGSTLGKKYIMAVSGAAMVLFVTGHARSDGTAPDWAALGTMAAQGITLVVYMGIGNASEIACGLLRSIAGSTPTVIVENASLPQQRHIGCRLDELSSVVSSGRIGSPAIIIIGDVARGCDAVQLSARHSTGT